MSQTKVYCPLKASRLTALLHALLVDCVEQGGAFRTEATLPSVGWLSDRLRICLEQFVVPDMENENGGESFVMSENSWTLYQTVKMKQQESFSPSLYYYKNNYNTTTTTTTNR